MCPGSGGDVIIESVSHHQEGSEVSDCNQKPEGDQEVVGGTHLGRKVEFWKWAECKLATVDGKVSSIVAMLFLKSLI